jgi:hypothetical protein
MLQRLAKLNEAPPKDPRALHAHFSGAYFSLRIGLALLAFVFPLLLYFWGSGVHDIGIQPSMSAYFWAADPTHCASFPMRTIFVGVLIAIAAALWFYKGLTDLENGLLNLAAVFALVVAMVPENLEVKRTAADPIPPRVEQLYASCPAVATWAQRQDEFKKQHDIRAWPYHYVSAVLMFVCLFFVMLRCACKSLEYLPKTARVRPKTFKWIYQAVAWSMVGYAVVLGALIYVFRDRTSNLIFCLEAGEIWIFAFYWAIKTWELSLSKLEADPPMAVQHAKENADSGMAPVSQGSVRIDGVIAPPL